MTLDEKTRIAQRQAAAMKNPRTTDDVVDDHPIGSGVGALAGASAGVTTGAVLGSAAGPAGTVVGAATGAVLGGIAGAAAGGGIAEMINPTTVDEYWSKQYANRPYIDTTRDYNYYSPAYRYGAESYTRFNGRSFDEVEADIARDWRDESLSWDNARDAVRDSYDWAGTYRTRS